MTIDVVVIGGGAIGSSAAYFLAQAGAAVTVIEPDPTYEKASTPRASGGCRRLFTRPENIRMSQFSIEFFAGFAAHLAVDGEAPDIGWKQRGYLFVVPPAGVETLRRNHGLQSSLGVEVELMDPGQLAARYPSLRVDDLGAAVLSPRDGWLDPNAVLQGFRRKARSLGADYRADRVVGLDMKGAAVEAVRLESGAALRPRMVVNAAGAWAAGICAMIGMALPVEPMRRFDHYFESPAPLEPLPLIKDLERLVFRPEGTGYTAGLVNYDEPRGFNFEVDHGYFERVVWPAVAHRLPALETLRLRRSWSGLYDQNRLDGNMILGNWPGRAENFHVAAGFSGHGLMHAPAVGRALAELIARGRFETIDLSRMSYRRVIEDEPYPELGII